jgi:hypothetical protein
MVSQEWSVSFFLPSFQVQCQRGPGQSLRGSLQGVDLNGFFITLIPFKAEGAGCAQDFYTQVSKESTAECRKKTMKMWFLAVGFCGFGGMGAFAGEIPPFAEAIRILDATPTGFALRQRAYKRGVPVVPGPVSKTDLIATRTGEGPGREIRTELRVVVALDKEPVFQALDLAHELTHAVGASVNPFDPNLDPFSYVKSGIEGAGGEASAIRAECEVAKEILAGGKRLRPDPSTRLLIRARCASAWRAATEPSRWIDSFYQLGQHYYDFLHALSGLGLDQSKLARWKARLSARSPLFSSAVTHKPYPLALLEEYVEMTRKVCSRAKETRLRAPASVSRMKGRCEALGLEMEP